MNKDLILYSRTLGCPYVTLAKRVLDDYAIPYREIMIDRDEAARQRVLDWTGFLAVPTLVVAESGSLMPHVPPAHLERGLSPRGVNRGSIITEPSADQLKNWLAEQGFLQPDSVERE